MKFLSPLFFCLSAGFAFGQPTFSADPAFGTDYNLGKTGVSTIYLNDQIASGGPMATPKCSEMLGNNFLLVSSKTSESSGAAHAVLVMKNAFTGADVQKFNLDNSEVISSGTNGLSIPYDIHYDVTQDKIYVVGYSTSVDKGFVFRLKRKPSKFQTSTYLFEYDPTFDGDGKYWFGTGSRVTGVCIDGTETVVCRDGGNEVYVDRFSSTGVLLTESMIPNNNAHGDANKSMRIMVYPGLNKRYFVVGSAGSYPALWGVDYNSTSNAFDQTVSNSLTGAMEGTGQFRDLCFIYNTTTYKYDIICVGSTLRMEYDASGGAGIYIKYQGTTASYINLAAVSSFKNTTSLPGTGVTNAGAATMCAFKSIVPYGSGFLLTGPYSDNYPSGSTYETAICYLSSAGQTVYNCYVAQNENTIAPVHFPGNLVVSGNTAFYVGCEFSAVAVKLNITP